MEVRIKNIVAEVTPSFPVDVERLYKERKGPEELPSVFPHTSVPLRHGKAQIFSSRKGMIMGCTSEAQVAEAARELEAILRPYEQKKRAPKAPVPRRQTCTRRDPIRRKAFATISATGECYVCLEAAANTLLQPCGHLVCRGCVRELKNCPKCRANIRTTMPVYMDK